VSGSGAGSGITWGSGWVVILYSSQVGPMRLTVICT